MNEIAKSPALATPALSKASFKPLAKCENLGEAFASIEFRDRIAAAAPNHIKPGRLLQTFVGAVSKYPLLRECSVRSYIGACLNLSQTGFEANTALGHAFLIPFRESKWNPQTRKREPVGVNINVIFGYPGLIDLSYRTGLVRNIHPDVVYPGDDFSYEYGSNAHLKHIPRGRREGEQPTHAYMHATLKDGEAFEVMLYSDVLSIRNKAQAYRYALEAKEKAEAEGKRAPMSWTEAPWVAHEAAMARKTAIRAGSKWLPRSVELYSALALEDAQERHRVDFGAALDAPTIDGTPDYLGATVDAADGEGDDEPTGGTRTQVQVNKPPAEDAARRAALAAEQRAAAVRAKAATAARELVNREIPNTRAVSTPAVSQQAAGFEAVLVDGEGEVQDDTFHDPILFAEAFMWLWAKTEPAERDRFIAANAGSIEEARENPEAAEILARMEAEPEDQGEPATQHVIGPVEPPADRGGKPNWPAWVKLIKTALPAIGADDYGVWTAAQHDIIAASPLAQRTLAIRAIAAAAPPLNLEPPMWLADLLKPRKERDSGQRSAVSGQEQASNEPASEPVLDHDERWVNSAIADVAGITTRAGFDDMVGSTTVRTVMARLRRDKPTLFERADHAFSAKHQTLPPAENV